MVAVCYHGLMNLHIRDLPETVHATLVRRAEARGMSLRAYVVEVLSAHSSMPTTDEWLAELGQLPSSTSGLSATEALDAEREERDAEIVRAASRR
jgi:plasmid stability protein